MNFEGIAPTVATKPPVRTRNTNRGPNPFLEEGWLYASYEAATADGAKSTDGWYEVTVSGSEVEYFPKVKDKDTGERRLATEPSLKLTGDAAEVVNLIRDAANKMDIGVSIDYELLTHQSGKNKGQPNGQVTIKYRGKKRNLKKRKNEVSADTVTDAE